MSGRQRCVSEIGSLWKQLNKFPNNIIKSIKKAHQNSYGLWTNPWNIFWQTPVISKSFKNWIESFVVQCVWINWWWISKTNGKITPTHTLKQTQGTISHYLFIYFPNVKMRLSQFVFQVLMRGTSQSIDVVYLLRALSISSCILHFWCVFDMFRWLSMMNIKHIFFIIYFTFGKCVFYLKLQMCAYTVPISMPTSKHDIPP